MIKTSDKPFYTLNYVVGYYLFCDVPPPTTFQISNKLFPNNLKYFFYQYVILFIHVNKKKLKNQIFDYYITLLKVPT